VAVWPGSGKSMAVAAPSGPSANAPIDFLLDDGSYEASIGFGSGTVETGTESAAIWLSRFTPPVGAYPVTIDNISIAWPSQGTTTYTNLLSDQIARLLVYGDADGDGDPSNAVLLGQ